MSGISSNIADMYNQKYNDLLVKLNCKIIHQKKLNKIIQIYFVIFLVVLGIGRILVILLRILDFLVGSIFYFLIYLVNIVV